MQRRLLPFLLAPAFFLPAALAAQKERLFSSDTAISMTLRANFKAIAKDRDTLSRKQYPGILSYTGPDGAPVFIPVQLSTRGHFRLRTCDFPPLRVRFPEEEVKGTFFAHQKSLKLVVHCRNAKDADERVLQEYLAYRVYNLITPWSYRARLVHATYTQEADTTSKVQHYGFFIEGDQDMAERLGGQLTKQQGYRFTDVDSLQGDILSLFEYLLGNTDWSIVALHNIRVVADSSLTLYPVPYDFDWSGMMSMPYAVPDPRLNTKTVRERVYRGPCRKPEALAGALRPFFERREQIYALFRDRPELTPGRVKDMLSYFDEFYRTASDRKRLNDELARSCR